MQVEALIFDFDGLVIDTETPDFEILADMYREHGTELQVERWVAGLGTVGGFRPYAELAELIGRPLDSEQLTAEHRRRYLARCATQPLRPGVAALLAYAKEHGIGLAVASSSTRDWVEGWLEQHQIRSAFTCVRTRNDVTRVKPAPDLFLAAAECLGIVPELCVVLEDSLNGMRAATAAGMRCVAVPLPLLDGLELPAHTLRLRTLADYTPAELIQILSAEAT